MPVNRYDYAIFIGRFQPLHNGHIRVIDKALQVADKVIILVGSSGQARSYRNPFTFEERKNMIKHAYGWHNALGSDRIIIKPIQDFPYNEQNWIEKVQKTVLNAVMPSLEGNTENVTLHGLNEFKITLIGCEKDHTSYYLKLFPNWHSIAVKFLDPISATDIREKYFALGGDSYNEQKLINEIFSMPLPIYVQRFLQSFACPVGDYKQICDEYQFVKQYKKGWKNTPYPPIFSTVDAVVIQSGHVLLVKRGAKPGEGQLALPGGFLNVNEKIQDAVIRELREETKIDVPEPVLRGSIAANEVFDDPNRSSRGRTITHAFLIKLVDRTYLPKVKGSDDAAKAFWVPLGELKEEEMFEDHFHIVKHMVAQG